MKRFKMKYGVFFIVLALSSALFLAFWRFAGLLGEYVDIYLPLGASLILGNLHYLSIFSYALLAAGTVLFSVINPSRHKIPLICVVVLTAAALVFFHSDAYTDLYCKAYAKEREQIAAELGSGESDLPQVDEDTYFTADVRISYAGTVYVCDAGEDPVYVFQVYRGKTYGLLVYLPDGGELDSGVTPWGKELRDIRSIGEGWFSAKITVWE